ncbi:type I pullulanase [Aquibacillus sediminis]|uniref:type I pullulanase n=1 Tax=Aquibacillus sediminis TaxID=2574734 RepID=UPI001108FA8D|nr:type I pullulanase [Aquibacillus sediminis]
MMKEIAWQDEKDCLTVKVPNLMRLRESVPKLVVEGQVYTVQSVDWLNEETATIRLHDPLLLGKHVQLDWGEIDLPVYPRKVVRTAWFDQLYDACEEQLGAIYTSRETKFSVWAPTATNVTLLLNDKRITMGRKPNGVWHTLVAGDWKNTTYHYSVMNDGEEKFVNDPYAKSMTANSAQSVVIDLDSTDPPKFRSTTYPSINKQDAIIYELHIRDATSSPQSGARHKGRFLGLTEENTSNKQGFSSGLSYIKELGCTHVQLLPVQDFARVDELHPKDSYNWGYDPLFYFVPEGSYATDANDPPLRVQELKQMIQAFHQQGLSVILDVVYNHVFCYENSAFEQLVPGYYLRYRSDGTLSNGSGTGNDLATERKMVRQFILDCVEYWLDEYRVDGFRFDLMGAIDLETMQSIQDLCSQKDRPILLLGEGWDLATELPAEQKSTNNNSDQLQHVSFFNDLFRDLLKGNLFQVDDVGYVNGNGQYFERLPPLVAGCCDARFSDHVFSNPLQSVNYVECHDNHTLTDRLKISNPTATDADRKRMHQLATGLVLISQGIPFLHAGQEFFRTKQGDDNSYISGDDINQLDWEQRGEEEENIQWVRNLISLRHNYRLFRMNNVKEIQERLHIIQTPNPVFGFMLMGEEEDFAIFINPTAETNSIDLPVQGRWEKLISNDTPLLSPISCLLQPWTKIGAYEFVVWKKQRV